MANLPFVESGSTGERPTTHIAKWIVPLDGPPIERGCLAVCGERIVAVNPRRPAEGEICDWGDAIIVPGFVNAHAHLEFSGLSTPLGRAGMPFHDWIREILACRRSAEFNAPAAVLQGLEESRRRGVTTIGDIASTTPEQLFDAPPDESSVVAFVELIGLTETRAAEQIERLESFLRRRDAATVRRGISPHAPYTVRPGLLETAVSQSAQHRLPLAFHLAESREELQLLRDGVGPLVDYMRDLGFWDSDAIPRGTRPLDYLHTLARAYRSLVIHGNYLTDDEVEFLAAHADRMATVYCPRTHAYFGHEPHPLQKLLAAGASVALGTDGRCTNPDLDLLAEMRFVAAAYPQLSPERILRLGTLDGAAALGVAKEVGSLTPGKYADFVLFEDDSWEYEPCAAVLSRDSHVAGVWHRGRDVAGLIT